MYRDLVLGLVAEDKPSEFSCSLVPRPISMLHAEIVRERGDEASYYRDALFSVLPHYTSRAVI